MSIKNEIKKRVATLIMAKFVAIFLAEGLFINSIIPKITEIMDINANIWKFIFGGICGDRISVNEVVANIAEIPII